MFIHWFPGHMTKALREMEANVSKIDCVIYVLDARIPLSSVNPAYEEIFKTKKRLYILNKVDLIPQEQAIKWKAYFAKDGNKCISANSTINGGNKLFISTLKELNHDLIERYKAKGVKKTVRAMVIGIPNCGKSTLINSLVSKKRAQTGNKPGVTRGSQWVSIDEYVDLLDTPGTLFPDFSDQIKATHLAIVGSVSENVIDNTELAMEILKFLKLNYPNNLLNKYSIDTLEYNELQLIEHISKKRGYILRGGELDFERTTKAIIQDFRKQAFGKIILEKL